MAIERAVTTYSEQTQKAYELYNLSRIALDVHKRELLEMKRLQKEKRPLLDLGLAVLAWLQYGSKEMHQLQAQIIKDAQALDNSTFSLGFHIEREKGTHRLLELSGNRMIPACFLGAHESNNYGVLYHPNMANGPREIKTTIEDTQLHLAITDDSQIKEPMVDFSGKQGEWKFIVVPASLTALPFTFEGRREQIIINPRLDGERLSDHRHTIYKASKV